MDTLAKVLPPKYASYASVVMVLVPWVGRAFYALKNDGGLIGVYRSILYGSTTVHNPPAEKNETAKPTP